MSFLEVLIRVAPALIVLGLIFSAIVIIIERRK